MSASLKSGLPGNRDAFAAYICDENALDVLRPVVIELGWPPEKCNKGGLRNAIQSLSVSASPNILMVDLSESGDPLNDINALAEVCEPGTVVIAIGQVNDVRLYRDLLASGIHDYLLKPLSANMLRDSLTQAQAVFMAPKAGDDEGVKRHISTAVIGTRGGVGASTLVTSLAWLFSAEKRMPTALLDLDVHFGTGALTLDLEPGRGLTDAIDNPSRIDGLFIERAMVKASEKLAVLSAEAPINTPLMTDGTAFLQLQEEMRAAFEATVVDLPRSMLILYPHLIRDTQSMVVVTELTLAAARDTIRLLSWLKANAPQTQVTVVANRVHAAGQLEISRKDFEQSIERKIDFLIPFDQKLAAQAAKLGKPLAEAGKNSRTIAPIIALTRHVLNAADDMVVGDDDGGTGKPKSKSLLGGMSAMLSKRSKK